jgi:hypothetical protein
MLLQAVVLGRFQCTVLLREIGSSNALCVPCSTSRGEATVTVCSSRVCGVWCGLSVYPVVLELCGAGRLLN